MSEHQTSDKYVMKDKQPSDYVYEIIIPVIQVNACIV